MQQLIDRLEITDLISRLGLWLDGDTATAGANSIVTFPDRTLTERYAFETRRTPEGWRLTRIAMV